MENCDSLRSENERLKRELKRITKATTYECSVCAGRGHPVTDLPGYLCAPCYRCKGTGRLPIP